MKSRYGIEKPIKAAVLGSENMVNLLQMSSILMMIWIEHEKIVCNFTCMLCARIVHFSENCVIVLFCYSCPD